MTLVDFDDAERGRRCENVIERKLSPADRVDEVSGAAGKTNVVCSWDIREKILPQVTQFNRFEPWPEGNCQYIYSAVESIEASRHSSGWAMRNTNNHNVFILKKSCLGILVCDRRCVDDQGSSAVFRPAICDKARAKQVGKPCPKVGCGGKLELSPCRGQSGFPVTHFWRTVVDTVYFHGKGTHDHPKPQRYWPPVDRKRKSSANNVGQQSTKSLALKRKSMKFPSNELIPSKFFKTEPGISDSDVATRTRQAEPFDTTPIVRTFSTSGPIEQDLQDLIDVLSKDASHPTRVMNTVSAGNRLDCQASTKQWPGFQTMKLENSAMDSVAEPWQWHHQDGQQQVQQQHQSQMQSCHHHQLQQQSIDFKFINKISYFDCSAFEKPFHPQTSPFHPQSPSFLPQTPPMSVDNSFHIQQLGENNFENQDTCTHRFAPSHLSPPQYSNFGSPLSPSRLSDDSGFYGNTEASPNSSFHLGFATDNGSALNTSFQSLPFFENSDPMTGFPTSALYGMSMESLEFREELEWLPDECCLLDSSKKRPNTYEEILSDLYRLPDI